MTVTPPVGDWVGPATRERPGPWPMPQGGNDVPNRTCSIDGCERKHAARGMCHMHWKRWAYANPDFVRTPQRPVAERFWEKVERTETCWLWTGASDVHGYGRFALWPKYVLAHRWSYEHLVGPIPNGLVIDHLCRNPPCVNPAHMEPVTQAENVRRGAALVTHCPRGHEYTPENTYVTRHGSRVCRHCHRIRQLARYHNGLPKSEEVPA